MARTSKQRANTTSAPPEAQEVVVVDGSNIATEGRSLPSLAQLEEAVTSFMAENPQSAITVVVDATFGHRIAKSEVKAYDAAVANNELVTPPAGAIGRGDAFVLSIADKVGARILSNDSFQEFHNEYPWLFDDGRLVGGKPVPNIGWVFVERSPVKGPKNRQSQRAGGSRRSTTSRAGSPAARSSSSSKGLKTAPSTSVPSTSAAEVLTGDASGAGRGKAASSGGSTGRSKAPPEPVNDTLPFLEFVENHPIGTSVNAEVESYSSHGAYVKVDDVLGYVPLALMANPAPTSARQVMAIGEALTLVVASYSPGRRSIDLAVPHMLPADAVEPSAVTSAVAEAAPPAKRTRKRATIEPETAAATVSTAKKQAAGTKAAAKRAAPKKQAAATKEKATKRQPAPTSEQPAAAKKQAAATKQPTSTRRAAATKRAASVTEQTAEAGEATGDEAAPTEPAASKRGTSRRSTRKRSAPTEPSPQETSSSEPTTDAPAPKKSAPKKTAAKKSTAKKSTAKKSTAKKSAAKPQAEEQPADAKPAASAGGASSRSTAKRAGATRATKKAAASKRGAGKREGDDG